MWPTITAIAAAATNQPASDIPDDSAFPTSTAAVPFNASSNSVTTPAVFPARRETLVAPVPPDPLCLMSPPCFKRTIKYPNGIDPIK
jgi:hypothetical protein